MHYVVTTDYNAYSADRNIASKTLEAKSDDHDHANNLETRLQKFISALFSHFDGVQDNFEPL